MILQLESYQKVDTVYIQHIKYSSFLVGVADKKCKQASGFGTRVRERLTFTKI